MTHMIQKKWINYLIISILRLIFIWHKFIKERLPHDIPFQLNILN
jgi:hypothetical protein